MFIVQGVIRLLRDPAGQREADEYYDSLLHATDGMYWNIYLERLGDPTQTIHSQGWKEQATSEAFGISEGFQGLRARSASSGGPRINLEGPLSPGYWRPVLNAEFATPPTGYDRETLGAADQSIVFVKPGQEAAYVEAERAIAGKLKGIDGVYWMRMYQSYGQPNAYSRIIHWRNQAAAEAGHAALGGTEAARQALIDEEQGGLCAVKLFSDWPERRASDGRYLPNV